MMSELEISKRRLLNVLIAFANFCEANSLCYTLSAGTLLGAIRHKGFIPWDDDIDVAMPRPDYNTLIKKFNRWARKNGYKYRVITYKNFRYFMYHSKIIDQSTLVIENRRIEKLGLWIDVFPIDYVKKASNIDEYKMVKEWVCKLKKIGTKKIYRPVSLQMHPTRFLKNSIVNLLTYLKFCSFRNLRKYLYYFKIQMFIRKNPGNDNMCFYFNWICDLWFKMPELGVRDSVLVDFEGKTFCAMKNWDLYLKIHYGDYMKLPEEKDREVHKKEVFKVL